MACDFLQKRIWSDIPVNLKKINHMEGRIRAHYHFCVLVVRTIQKAYATPNLKSSSFSTVCFVMPSPSNRDISFVITMLKHRGTYDKKGLMILKISSKLF